MLERGVRRVRRRECEGGIEGGERREGEKKG